MSLRHLMNVQTDTKVNKNISIFMTNIVFDTWTLIIPGQFFVVLIFYKIFPFYILKKKCFMAIQSLI